MRALPPAPITVQPQCPGPQAFPRAHPCSGILRAPRPTVPSAQVSSKMPPRWKKAMPTAPAGIAFLSARLPEPPSKLLAAPTTASGRLSSKKGKNKGFKGFLHPSRFHGLSGTCSGHSHGRVEGSWNLAQFLPIIHCVTLGILSRPPFLHL